MKRKICSLLSVLMLASAITFSVPPVQVSAADFTATVNFSTTSPTAIDIGITGFHEATSTAQHNLNETSLINEMNNYDRVGYVRMQGTTINVMNWKTGALDPEMIAQVEANDKKYRMWEEGYMLTEARGFERWDDIRDFAQKTGVKLVITCNVFEMTMREIGEMAKYCYDNHLPVLHFELGNEVDFFTAESEDGLWPEKFKTGTDYLDRMRAYDTHIKRFYPGAKVIAVMSNIDK